VACCWRVRATAETNAIQNHRSRALANVAHSNWKASSVWVCAIGMAASPAASSSCERNFATHGMADGTSEIHAGGDCGDPGQCD